MGGIKYQALSQNSFSEWNWPTKNYGLLQKPASLFFSLFFFPYTTNRAEATLYFFLHPLSTTLHQIAPSSLLNEASARFYTHITKTLLPCTGFLSTTEQGNSQKSSKKKKLFVIISHSEGAIDWQQMICHIKHHVLP